MLAQILTAREPFGPRDADALVRADPLESDQLFDRNNLIYAQTSAAARPTYIIGRKGAGKTAFLHGAAFRAGAPPGVGGAQSKARPVGVSAAAPAACSTREPTSHQEAGAESAGHAGEREHRQPDQEAVLAAVALGLAAQGPSSAA